MSRSSVRSAITVISRQHLWPANQTYPGIANGWQGAAWVAFKLADAGSPVPDRVFESIGRRLTVDLRRDPRNNHFGAFIGCAGDAVIAAYAARRGIVGSAVARTACRRVVSSARRNPAWDLQMGLAGALLAFAEIAAVEPGLLDDVQPGRLARRLLAQVDALCALPPCGWPTGMAHGPPGAIVALESCRAAGWCRITTRRRQRWIDALSRCAVAGARGDLYWPAVAGERELALQSWCAGTPGIALALLQCFRLTREPAYLDFARGALEGMKALSNKIFFSNTLCCGNAGYRHIFIEAYRITGEHEWLALAERPARFSRSTTRRVRLGLLQGQLGIAYLTERLVDPRAYPFPSLGVSSV